MSQFDVHRNTNPASKKRIPYLLDVQADLLGTLATRVVVPLAKPEVLRGKRAERLTPTFEIDGTEVVMLTPELAGVPAKILGAKVANIASQRREISAALDLLFVGF
jgi:toxin CcdB